MTYAQYLAGRPVVVTAALTGGIHGKETNPAIPETPAEIGQAAANVVEAGASVVHVHARQDSGERAFDTARFQAIDDAIRARTEDVIIQHSTGATGVPVDHRAAALRTDPPPEMASLDMGPVNRYRHVTSTNTRATVDRLYGEMADRGITPELEAFNDGHQSEVAGFLDRHEPDPPVPVSRLFGGGTLSPADPQTLLAAIQQQPAETRLNVIAPGRHHVPFATFGLLCGLNVRVGLEDNVYYRAGELADSNTQLVERVANLASLLERPLASPDQARDQLGLA